MCIAELNVSLSGCQHRWYHMLRPCIPGGNLNSCPGKIALEGWETRCDFCPFCAGWPLDSGEFLLFGGNRHKRSNSIGTPLSRQHSMRTSVSTARRDSRRDSLVRTDSNVSVAGNYEVGGPVGSPVHTASERNRAMNSRVNNYFEQMPENMVEAQGKRAPSSYNSWGLGRADENAEMEFVRRGSESTNSSGSQTTITDKAGRAWKKTKKRSSVVGAFFH